MQKKYGRYVCDKHFLESSKVPGTRRGLQLNAVLFLYGLLQIPQVAEVCSEKSVTFPPSTSTSFIKQTIQEINPTIVSDIIDVQNTAECSTFATGSTDISRRQKILQEVQCTRQTQLTPKCKKLYIHMLMKKRIILLCSK
ncbi:hypothetical protein RN001_003349 [Aquatica leii]|uniref:Uncharacterized protein n=1 Tax=Aquatica leii TaxID=1421715 RepID=A0AAN7PIG3_9COLE|nr:hypothetical protein RN001_003349 [Aquatica leii]